jgi:hypothetical protein
MKNETPNNHCAATDGKPPVSGSSSFICKGCKCEVPNNFSVKTDEYCYLCDTEVTLDECLQDEYPKSWR